jgi:hypothetical protein
MGYSKFAVNSVLLNLWAKQLRYLFGESVLSDFRILPAVYYLYSKIFVTFDFLYQLWLFILLKKLMLCKKIKFIIKLFYVINYIIFIF